MAVVGRSGNGRSRESCVAHHELSTRTRVTVRSDGHGTALRARAVEDVDLALVPGTALEIAGDLQLAAVVDEHKRAVDGVVVATGGVVERKQHVKCSAVHHDLRPRNRKVECLQRQLCP